MENIDLTKPLNLIPITERLPEVDQDVIVWNGQRLVAAKYVKRLVAVSQNPFKAEEQGQWQVEKYASLGDRSIVTNWRNITHWMPANL